MQALIDADLVAYRCAASAEGEPLEIAVLRTDKLMRQLIEETGSDAYRAFLTGTTNFRKEIDPSYKANRTQPSPKWLHDCKEFLVTEWKAEVADNCEADDLLGIAQCKSEGTVICSLDKDLLMIPGKHYRWAIDGTVVRDGIVISKWHKDAEFLEITPDVGLNNFYISTLVGDVSDNVVGVDKVGPVKAKKALEGIDTEQGMFDRCRSLYNDDKRFLQNLKLLWIWQQEEDIYTPERRGLTYQQEELLLNGVDTSEGEELHSIGLAGSLC